MTRLPHSRDEFRPPRSAPQGGVSAPLTLEIERLANHWRRVLPLRMLTIDYEALVADLECESRRLIEFLGLDWEAACLDFYKTERPVLTASAWQVRQPLFTR